MATQHGARAKRLCGTYEITPGTRSHSYAGVITLAAGKTEEKPPMTALPIEAPHTKALATECVIATRESSRTCTLDLSRSRTDAAAFDILKAYKLSGNFHGILEVVLNHMGVPGMVTHQIAPRSVFSFPDRRTVIFSCDENVPGDRFNEIMASIKARIGFETPWWGKLLRPTRPGLRRGQALEPAAVPLLGCRG
jgi:hypothetical protein